MYTHTPQIQNAGHMTPPWSQDSPTLEHFLQSKQALPFFFLIFQVAKPGTGWRVAATPAFPVLPWDPGDSGLPRRLPSISRSFKAPGEDSGGPNPSKESAGCREMGSWAASECHRGQYPGTRAPSLSRGALTICSLCRA